jgi:uncharacterized protein DUF6527
MNSIRAEFVEFIPESLAQSVLYISRRYKTASHLCACGCGSRVVTPLNASGWRVIERNGSVSLLPSIGSHGLPCRSHYWIRDNEIVWATKFSEDEIKEVRERDERDHDAIFGVPALSKWQRIVRWIKDWL